MLKISKSVCWQCGREGKGVVFTMNLIARLEFNPNPGHVLEFLNKTLYDDYLCWVASNKLQIYVRRSQMSTGKLRLRSTLSRCGFVQRIAPQSLSCGRIKIHRSNRWNILVCLVTVTPIACMYRPSLWQHH